MKSLVPNDYIINYSVFKGRVIWEPEYLKQELDEYENNPFIEALPPIFNMEEVIDQFTFYPNVKSEDKDKRANVRYHIIKKLKRFIQPLNIHTRIEQEISAMIRQGYLARNPCSIEFLQRLRLLNDIKQYSNQEIEEKFRKLSETLRSTADSLSIIGISGIGKTTAIERLFMMYPQVIHHSDYKGNPLIRTQIVWLKIDCPYDGSLKTLCKIFFKSIDDVIGTTKYFEKFGNNRNSAATMMIYMTYLASIYGIGVLAIDEMQHLINKKNDSDEMLNFFVTLQNVIGVPTILIGTFKALKVLKKDFRQARRAGSEGNIIWDRMHKDDEWDFFIETLWSFQWLSEDTEFSHEFNAVMYDESQGITAIAVNLFIVAQERALQSGTEVITAELIRKTAREDFHMIQPMIKALRSSNIEDICKYEDIKVNLEDIVNNVRGKIELQGRIKQFAEQEKRNSKMLMYELLEKLIEDISLTGLFNSIKDSEFTNIIENSLSKNDLDEEYEVVKKRISLTLMEKLLKGQNEKNVYNLPKIRANKSKDDLRIAFDECEKKKKPIYNALIENGYIKNPFTEFYGVV